MKKVKKIEYKVQIETKEDLLKRIKMPEKKLVIESDEDNKRFYFDTKINGKRIQTVAMLYLIKTACIAKDWTNEERENRQINGLFWLSYSLFWLISFLFP